MNLDAKTIDRFWAKVDKRGPHDCWLWKACTQPSGYGRFGLKIDGRHRTRGAHQVSFAIHGGTVAKGEGVLHSCDNPPCVNPAHLFSGNQKSNMADSSFKGRLKGRRVAIGEKVNTAKMSPERVRRLRALAISTTYAELGRQFGISAEQASWIVKRKSWRHIS